MTRNLRALGLGLIAVFAMGAILASVAQAEKAAVATVEKSPATIEGTQEGANVFNRAGREVTCGTATLHGTVTNGSESAEVTPTYLNCHAIVLGTKLPATVTMNGCTFKFTLTADAGDTFTNTASLICPANKTIEIHVYANETDHKNNIPKCTITIYGSSDEDRNTDRKHIDVTNEPAGGITPKNWLLGHITLTGIQDAEDKPGLICGPAESTTTTLTGTSRIKAKDSEGKDTGITISTKP
jgi:hypothetical protein